MKKTSLFLIVVSIIFINCAGNNSEKLREDSIRKADSIAAIQSEKEETERAAEQARLDSIRQDSIERAQKQMEAFTPSLFISKSEGWWNTKYNIPSSLKKIGFSLVQKKFVKDLIGYTDGETADGYNLKYSNEDIGVTVSWGIQTNSNESQISTEIAIYFNNQDLENMFVSKIKQMGFKKEDKNFYFYPDGLVVFINQGNSTYAIDRVS